jgi:hypothetical protein
MNFHGKVFHIPPHGVLVGSANATESGLGLLENSNSETCTIVEEDSSNVNFVNKLFQNSYKMNDDLFDTMKDCFENARNLNEFIEWPESIIDDFKLQLTAFEKLFISDCFSSDGKELLFGSNNLSLEASADLSLLGLSVNYLNHDSIAMQFKKTKIYSLLINLLKEQGGEIYFGTLTLAMHEWLIEDPAPYRREVKALVKNLYSWISQLGEDSIGLSVDRPNYSERIKIRL